MEQLTGYRMKIVERGGTKLVDILHKANLWAGEDCKGKGCLLCRTKGERIAKTARKETACTRSSA